MIDIRAALRRVLIDDATVATLVGNSRIYPGKLPQGVTEPSVVQTLISEETDYHLQGASGLVARRIQFDAWATEEDDADELARAVKDALSGFRGVVLYGSASPQSEANVKGIFAVAAREDFDAVSKMNRYSRDYEVWYYERP